MRQRVVADLSGLPISGERHSSPSWWGTLAFMLIEGTGFALAIGIYLYLAALAPAWPPVMPRTSPPAPASPWCCWRASCPMRCCPAGPMPRTSAGCDSACW
ncbi:hypothetical protein ACFQU2_16765 [Siccirubricoccus deserti]